MNIKMTLLLLLIPMVNCLGQSRSDQRVYEYVDQNSEYITLKKDSFHFLSFVGLLETNVAGTLKYRNDTLIFNSNYQADDFKIEERYNPNLKRGEFEILIIDTVYRNEISLYATSKSNRKEKTLLEPYDEEVSIYTLKSTAKYKLKDKKFSKRKGVTLKIWRKNVHFDLLFKEEKSNSISVEFLRYPKFLNYLFFKDVKAIETKEGLVFLGEENDLIKVDFTVKNEVKKKEANTKIYKLRTTE